LIPRAPQRVCLPPHLDKVCAGGYAPNCGFHYQRSLALARAIDHKTFGLRLMAKDARNSGDFDTCSCAVDRASLGGLGSKWLPTDLEGCYENAQFGLISIGYNQ
jgi:hypothetical protein